MKWWYDLIQKLKLQNETVLIKYNMTINLIYFPLLFNYRKAKRLK